MSSDFKREEYKDEKVNLKRQMQEMQVSSGTGLLDLENSTRCRQSSSNFDTSANVRSDRIPGHNRVCRIVKIAVGWRRRASRSKTQMPFTSSCPRHLSGTKRTRCSRASANSFSRKQIGRGKCLCGVLSAAAEPPQPSCTGSFLEGGGGFCLSFERERQGIHVWL